MSFTEMDYSKEIPFPQLYRYTLYRSKDESKEWKFEREKLFEDQLDLPTLNPHYVGKKVSQINALKGLYLRRNA